MQPSRLPSGSAFSSKRRRRSAEAHVTDWRHRPGNTKGCLFLRFAALFLTSNRFPSLLVVCVTPNLVHIGAVSPSSDVCPLFIVIVCSLLRLAEMKKAQRLDAEELVPWVYAPQEIEEEPRRLTLRRSFVLFGVTALLLAVVVIGTLMRLHPASNKDLEPTPNNQVECDQLEHQCKRFSFLSFSYSALFSFQIITEPAKVQFARARELVSAVFAPVSRLM
jgi:hypothetical protein